MKRLILFIPGLGGGKDTWGKFQIKKSISKNQKRSIDVYIFKIF